MMQDYVNNKYFEWLFNLVCESRRSYFSYKRLLIHLHGMEFRYSIDRDANRSEDGLSLRYRFAYEHEDIHDAEIYLGGPCSVLEMLIALAVKCEEDIMDDPRVGDRTSQWFWMMLTNLGLSSMHDDRYDRKYVDETVNRFLDREYEPNGSGGLFTIRNCDCDLRDVEIWYQLCWFLDNIT